MVGYKIRNMDTIETKYICPLCNLLLLYPVQLFCGHRCCKSCTGDHNRTHIKCWTCKNVTLRSKMFYDRGMKNDMEKLHISCFNCPWSGFFKNYRVHLIINHPNGYMDDSMRIHSILHMQELINKIHGSIQHMQLVAAKIKQILSDVSTYKISIEECNVPKPILPLNQDHIVSYDGRLLFIIDNVQNRLNSIQSVVTSPPFYTSPSGYKICVRIHFNGHGIGQSTHISIFLIIMSGDYDALLKWPFNSQVIFCLHNTKNQKDHFIKSFYPGTNLIHCQRPVGDKNIEIGFPQFIPLSIIHQNVNSYIYNDTMYIKVMVREKPIPISILPKIMAIDHALPVYIQEELIEKEIEKDQIQSFKLILTLKSKSST